MARQRHNTTRPLRSTVGGITLRPSRSTQRNTTRPLRSTVGGIILRPSRSTQRNTTGTGLQTYRKMRTLGKDRETRVKMTTVINRLARKKASNM